MYKVLIIDDEPLVQVGVSSMLDCCNLDIQICGTAANGKAGLELIEQLQPHIVITDIKMPVLSGLDMIKKCRELNGPNLPVFILLTGYEDFKLAKEAMVYQVTDYLVKLELTPEELSASIGRAVEKIKMFTPNTSLPEDNSELERQKLEERFYVRLINNLFETDAQISQAKKELNISLEYAAYQCCYIDFHTASADFSLCTSIYRMFAELAKKYAESVCLRLDLTHGVVIFFYEKLPSENENIYTSLCEIRDAISAYYGTVFTFGIGSTVTEPSSLHISFQDAKRSYRERNGKVCDKDTDCSREPKHHIVESVKAYIRSHVTDRLSLNDVAEMYDISPNYLSSLFKKYNELGYSEYVTYCKIEESKKLLRETNMKIYEIADALGFESSFYFSKVFKKVAGIAPTDYQKWD